MSRISLNAEAPSVHIPSLSTTKSVIADRVEMGIEGLLYGLLAFMPFAQGAVEAWSELVVYCLVGLMGLGLLVRLFLRSTTCRWFGPGRLCRWCFF